MIEADKINVLYVDDEPENLFAFKAAFRRTYEVFTANSADQGLAILKEKNIHVILADQRMPRLTGVEFFDIVRVFHPEPIRILITAYTDIDAIIDSINKGQIFRYIKKPWNLLEIDAAMKNAFEVYTIRQQLQQKVEELEFKNEELNKFVYSTSHDLRSPLASIRGLLGHARNEGSVVDPNGYLDMIDTCATKMDSFILKVIEYYRNNRTENTISPVDFNDVLQDGLDFATMKNPAIQFDVKVNSTSEFNTDALRLSVILNNLISNAVKYQRPEEFNPWVKITIDANEEEAVILIEDNGMGIKEQHLSNIFNMFFRSNSSVTGSGIGLYIVKEALSRIGGDITVQSTYGAGSSFRLVLPNQRASANNEKLLEKMY